MTYKRIILDIGSFLNERAIKYSFVLFVGEFVQNVTSSFAQNEKRIMS